MPTYEYKCTKCGHIFEEFQSIKSEPLTKCKSDGCDGDVKKLFSAGAGFIFKGKGFYATDYRSESYKKAAQSDSNSTASSGSSTSSAPEKKSSSTTASS